MMTRLHLGDLCRRHDGGCACALGAALRIRQAKFKQVWTPIASQLEGLWGPASLRWLPTRSLLRSGLR